MNRSSKTRPQLLFEIEGLRTGLDVARQRLQEANDRLVASEESLQKGNKVRHRIQKINPPSLRRLLIIPLNPQTSIFEKGADPKGDR
jgi:hypothetical protein